MSESGPVSALVRAGNTAWVGAYALVERRVPFLKPETIERLQRWRLRRIIRHAWETVPFYRNAMAERGLRPSDFRTADDLAKLPLIDLSDVAQDPETFCSSLYPDSRRLCLKTSGSSQGFALRVYWDHSAVLAKVAHAERDRVILATIAGKNWGQRQLHIMGYGAGRVRRFVEAHMFAPQRAIHRIELPPDTPIDEIAQRINEVRPEIVFSYGSFAEVLFRTISDSGKRIFLPRVWVYGGDVLSAEVRRTMEEQGCTVYSTYQTTETGRLGFQCERRRGFHLNVDLCAVRLIDPGIGAALRQSRNPTRDESLEFAGGRAGWAPEASSDRADETSALQRAVKPGEVGELVVSNLHNRAMVLLNYRLGDLGVIATEPCECGRSLPVLRELQGRVSQIIPRADGTVISALTLRHQLAAQIGLTVRAQIVYTPPGLLLWKIVPAAGASPSELSRAFVEATGRVLGPGTRVEVEIVEAIPAAESGKFPSFVRRR